MACDIYAEKRKDFHYAHRPKRKLSGALVSFSAAGNPRGRNGKLHRRDRSTWHLAPSPARPSSTEEEVNLPRNKRTASQFRPHPGNRKPREQETRGLWQLQSHFLFIVTAGIHCDNRSFPSIASAPWHSSTGARREQGQTKRKRKRRKLSGCHVVCCLVALFAAGGIIVAEEVQKDQTLRTHSIQRHCILFLFLVLALYIYIYLFFTSWLY